MWLATLKGDNHIQKFHLVCVCVGGGGGGGILSKILSEIGSYGSSQ